MKRVQTACLQCRARLAARLPPSSPLGFRSRSQNGNNSLGFGRPKWHPARSLTTDTAAATTENVRPQQPQPSSKHGKRQRRAHPSPDAALAVFRDIVESQQQKKLEQDSEDKKQGKEPASVSPSSALYNQLIKLTQMRSRGASVASLFAFFEAELYPHIAQSARDLDIVSSMATQQLVREVTTAKQLDFVRPDLPTVARITEVRRQLNLLNIPQPWCVLMMGLAEAVFTHSPAGRVTRSDAGSSGSFDAAARASLLDDLVQSWRLFSLPDILVSDPDVLARLSRDDFRLPAPDPAVLERYAFHHEYDLAIFKLFPRYPPRQLHALLPVVFASYALLTDPAVATPAAARNAKPFLDAIAHILRTVPIDRQTVADLFVDVPDLGSYVLMRWPLATPEPDVTKLRRPPLRKEAGSTPLEHRPNAATIAAGNAAKKAPVLLDSIHSMLSQALRARNLDACEAAWNHFWAALSVPDAVGAERLHRSAELFDFFIMAFTTMRMPHRAIAVWNLMAMAGIQPTLRTWTSFMEGCKLASNPTGIHNIWTKLMASGLPVDTAVWTARISGLIAAGEPDAGVRALEEMQQMWEASPVTAVRPTVEPVNAAIAGLLRRDDLPAAKRILAWAGRHGIEPDMITFNTILRPLVREGRTDEMAGLLEMMRRRGLQPDEATVTILLEGTLGGGALAGRSPDDKIAVVRRVLDAVDAAGLHANHQTYAKMIHLLLLGSNFQPDAGVRRRRRHVPIVDDDFEGTDAAIQVVFNRMRQRNLPLSSAICTILAEHYLAQQPPDLEALEALIQHSFVSPSLPTQPSPASSVLSARLPAPPPFLDRVFWERVVRGYALLGDADRAMKYYGQIAASLSVTMSTLEALLQALIDNGEWAKAQQLVAKALAQTSVQLAGGQGGEEALAAAAKAVAGVGAGVGAGAGAAGSGTRRGSMENARQFRHRFWHLAAQYGLMPRRQ